ncbi:MAG: tetratricopeptide repeat protein [Xanthobacteraceae bacterium]
MKLTLKHALAAIILVLSFTAPVAAGPFEDATAAYSRGDYATALRLWHPLADQGDSLSQAMLGFMYYKGEGVPKDSVEAAKWLRKSADKGDVDAQAMLGAMYDKGDGVLKDYAEAAKWLRKSADQGNAGAQSILGTMFSYGQGVPQDYAEAMKWFRKSAEQGDADAQVGLGIIYANGHGVPQDYAEAMKWLRKSADQGNADGEFYLGLAYAKGQGVTQDYPEANKWFRKSADQGDLGAQSILGFNYAAGRGVSQNSVEALKWSILAVSQTVASQSNPNAGALRDAAAHNRDLFATKMSANQIAEAQKLAREWKPTTPPPRSETSMRSAHAHTPIYSGNIEPEPENPDLSTPMPSLENPEMSHEEAQDKIKAAGLDKQITVPEGRHRRAAIDLMIRQAQAENERASTIARGPRGFLGSLAGALGFLVVVAVRMIDPISIILAVVLGALATVAKERSVQWLIVGIGAVAMTIAFGLVTSYYESLYGVVQGRAWAPMTIITTLTAAVLQIAFAAGLFGWWRRRGDTAEGAS